MAALSELKLTFGYADETKRDLKIGPFKPTDAAISGAKVNVMGFNSDTLDDVKNLLLSDDGASCTGIIAAEINTVEETEINLND